MSGGVSWALKTTYLFPSLFQALYSTFPFFSHQLLHGRHDCISTSFTEVWTRKTICALRKLFDGEIRRKSSVHKHKRENFDSLLMVGKADSKSLRHPSKDGGIDAIVEWMSCYFPADGHSYAYSFGRLVAPRTNILESLPVVKPSQRLEKFSYYNWHTS